MELWDTIITFAIIGAAAFYIYRRFSRAKKGGGGCGCGSESSCCDTGRGDDASNCGGQHR